MSHLDLKALYRDPPRRIPHSPTEVDTTLDDLFESYIRPILLDPAVVIHYHRILLDYARLKSPLWLVRQVQSLTRGKRVRTASGDTFIPTDNSPPYWMHFVSHNRLLLRKQDFSKAVTSIPSHFFEVGKMRHNINDADWHVAHIFRAKDGRTNYREWSADDLRWRFIRNIHPCNYFYIPKTEWRRFGDDVGVVSYFALKHKKIYSDIWDEFLQVAGGQCPDPTLATPNLKYRISKQKQKARYKAGTTIPTYEHSRLSFRADVIEPLALTDSFEVITPQGAFLFTKAQFYSEFPKVIASKSYQEERVYHYPATPRKALRYLTPRKPLS